MNENNDNNQNITSVAPDQTVSATVEPTTVPTPVNPVQVDSTQPVAQSIEQPVVQPTVQPVTQSTIPQAVQPVTQPTTQQVIQPVTPMAVNQPQIQSNITSDTNKKNNIILICIIIVLSIVAIICISMVFKDKNSKESSKYPINEYDSDKNRIVSTTGATQSIHNNNSSTYEYNGFVFNVINDYEYEVYDDLLVVSNDSAVYSIGIIEYDYDDILSDVSNIMSEIAQEYNANISNIKESTYGGIKMITSEADSQGTKFIFGYAKSSISGYTINYQAFNDKNTVDYSLLNSFSRIISGITTKSTDLSPKAKNVKDVKINTSIKKDN